MSFRNTARRVLLSLSPLALKHVVILLQRVRPSLIGDFELSLLPILVPRNRPALDVGMHYGLYSVFLERIVGAENLYGFEPLPTKIPVLQRMFSQSHILPIALSDHGGTASLHVPTLGGKPNTSRATLRSCPGTEASTIPVQTDRLDNLYARGIIKDAGFAKIDVEGHEVSLLAGATEFIHNFRPNLIIEIEQRHHEVPISHIFETVENLAYALYFILPESHTLAPRSAFNAAIHQNISEHGTRSYVANFIALPQATARRTLRSLEQAGICLASDSRPAA